LLPFKKVELHPITPPLNGAEKKSVKYGERSQFRNPNWSVQKFMPKIKYIQGDFESCADILITSYWLHVQLGKNI
jgi:hypothetical protein